MKILTYNLGIFSVNCYLVYDEKSSKACLIDPAVYDSKVMKIISEKGLSLEYIILTHGHFDHILGTNKFKEMTSAKIVAHELEVEYLQDPAKSMTAEHGGGIISPDILLKDGDVLTLGDSSLKVIHTPGHTKGSCCFYCEKQKILFSGDTIFKGAVGCWNLYGGSYDDLIKSLRKLKFIIDKNYKIYSGHGYVTTCDNEVVENYYLREAISNFD